MLVSPLRATLFTETGSGGVDHQEAVVKSILALESTLVRPGLATMHAAQVADDVSNWKYVPDLGRTSTEETVLIGGEEVRIEGLDENSMIAQQTFSTVFELDEHVIKYFVNCEQPKAIHNLVREYWILRHLENENVVVVPQVEMVSPPAKFHAPHGAHKTDFSMNDELREQCASQPMSSVRYMVMEKAELPEFRREGIPLIDALDYMRGLVDAVRLIHEKGVLHGDIHLGNVGLFRRPLENKRDNVVVGLLDFGRSFFADVLPVRSKLSPKSMKFRMNPEAVFCHFSMYENRNGELGSYRDDIFRAVMVGVFSFRSSSLCSEFGTDRDAFTNFLEESDMFFDSLVEGEDLIPAKLAGTVAFDSVQHHLMKVQTMIRNIEEPLVQPEPRLYTDILKHIDAATHALKRHRGQAA